MWTRHLSMSVGEAGKFPSPSAFLMIAQEFGFEGNSIEELGEIYKEEYEPGHFAINVIQKRDANKTVRDPR